MNLGEILLQAANQHPDACAIRFQGRRHSFRAVAGCVQECTQKIQDQGVVKGDRVALLISNVPAFPVAYFATLWAEAIIVPVNPLLSDSEVVRLLDDCQAKLLIVEDQFLERSQNIGQRCQSKYSLNDSRPHETSLLENPVKVESIAADPVVDCTGVKEGEGDLKGLELDSGRVAEETAVILYTSGSTGRPKGVELTHSNLWLNAKSVSEEKFSTPEMSNVLGPGHVGLAAIPLSHAFGQSNLQNGIWFGGGAMAFQQRFETQQTLELMKQEKVTFFAGVPTMYFELVRIGRQLDIRPEYLKYCVCGGAAVSPAIKQEFEQLFGVRIQESYGLTETSPMVSCQRIDRTQKSGCVGAPIEGVNIRLVDDKGIIVGQGTVGEIHVQGHNVFRGYYKRPQETKEAISDGWFRTGDLGKLDEDGELWIVDRLKEVINRGGYQIYPREIENVLHALPEVEAAAVVGIADAKYGEQVIAFVTLTAADSPNTRDPSSSVIAKIVTDCKKKLAAYKFPDHISVLEELPKGSTGKIDKIQLRKQAGQLKPH